MYITLSDRPDAPAAPRDGRRRVAPVVVTLGLVSLVTDISSESVAAILPLYLTGVARALDDRVRLHRRALPGRQRAGADRRRLGGRPRRPPEVGRVRSATGCPPSPASSCCSAPGWPPSPR